MFGRLIVCVLVICSAAAVAWQRQRSEAVDIGAAVTETKAAEADTRAAAAEERAMKAEERAAVAEAKASFFEAQLADHTVAADDPVLAAKKIHVVGIRYLGVKTDRHGRNAARFALSLAGNAGVIERIRMVPLSGDSGEPLVTAVGWDTQDQRHAPLDVQHGGEWLVDGHAQSVMTTRDGTTLLALSLPAMGAAHFFFPGATFRVDVDAAGDAHSFATITLDK
jgi:hypothetical protein